VATKPVTLPARWNSAGIYTTGPFIGSVSRVAPGVGIAAEGHRPGALFPTAAEHENHQQYWLTGWIREWVFLGSSAGGADAHPLETSSDGGTQVTHLDIIDAVDRTSLVVTGVNTLAPLISGTATAGGGTVFQAIQGPNAVGFATSVGAGSGTGFDVTLLGASANAAGVRVVMTGGQGACIVADASSLGRGVVATTDGIGAAGSFSSTGIGNALFVSGNVLAPRAAFVSGGTTQSLEVLGLNAAAAAKFTGGSSAINAVTVASLLTTGNAVVATVAAAATATARGFFCAATNLGIAAEFTSAGNYALVIAGDPTSPTYGALSISPQNADPAVASTGDITVTTTKGLQQANFADGNWRSFWSSPSGYAAAWGTVYGFGVLALTIVNAAYQVVGTITTASSGDEVKVAGATIILRLSFSVRSNSTSPATMSIRIRDVTAGVTKWERVGTGGGDTAGYYVPGFDALTNLYWVPGPTVEFEATVPATGARSYSVSMAAPVVPYRVRDVTMAFVGTVG